MFDGENGDGAKIGRFCGTYAPESITSTHNFLTIQYQNERTSEIEDFVDSVYNGQRIRFLLNYTVTDLGCGGILKDRIGVIQSHIDSLHYPSNKFCRWLISAPVGSIIQLNWVTFDLEKSFNCTADYVVRTFFRFRSGKHRKRVQKQVNYVRLNHFPASGPVYSSNRIFLQALSVDSIFFFFLGSFLGNL